MRPMDGYIDRLKSAKTDAGIELIIQEVYELGFDKGKMLGERFKEIDQIIKDI